MYRHAKGQQRHVHRGESGIFLINNHFILCVIRPDFAATILDLMGTGERFISTVTAQLAKYKAWEESRFPRATHCRIHHRRIITNTAALPTPGVPPPHHDPAHPPHDDQRQLLAHCLLVDYGAPSWRHRPCEIAILRPPAGPYPKYGFAVCPTDQGRGGTCGAQDTC